MASANTSVLNGPPDEITAHVEKMAPEQYCFFNEPTPITREELDRYLGDLSRETSTLPGLTAIYQEPHYLGDAPMSVRLILVYRPEDLDLGRRRFPDVIRVIGTRNVLDENYLSVDPKLLESLFKFDPFVTPEHLCGERLTLTRPPDEDIRFFLISRLLDLFAGGYLEEFYRLEVLRKVDVRVAHDQLRRLVRLLQMSKAILRKKRDEQWDPVIERVELLQRGWFELGMERYVRLMHLLRDSSSVLYSVIAALESYFDKAMVAKYHLNPGAQSPQAVLVTEDVVTVFIDPWDPVEAITRSIELSRKLEQFVSVLPVSFALQLHLYSTGGSSFNRYIKTCFRVGGLEGNLERPYIVWERGQLLDRYLELLRKLRQDEDPSGVLLGCDVPRGSAIGRAGDMVKQQTGKLRLKKMLRFLQDEVRWDSTPAVVQRSERV